MIVLYEKSFLRDLKKVKDQNIRNTINDVIENIKSSKNLQSIPQLKKLKGHPTAYRIRFGDFRIGIFFEKNTVIFTRILNRKDIYSRFP